MLSTITERTMTSVELVKIINEYREEGQAELLHKNFLAKIEKVLGDSSAKFLAVYKDQQDIDRKCYNLPKRECNLMVMSESYKVQAAVYDRMTELEVTKPKIVDPKLAALVESLIRLDQVEQEQNRIAEEQKHLKTGVEALTTRLNQIETATNHFTVAGWCNLVGRTVPTLEQAARMGKQATKECKERGLDTGKVPDPRFGVVKTYPKFILDELFLD